MESIRSVKASLHQEDFLGPKDIKDAYLNVFSVLQRLLCYWSPELPISGTAVRPIFRTLGTRNVLPPVIAVLNSRGIPIV